jgi:hypothetical protein
MPPRSVRVIRSVGELAAMVEARPGLHLRYADDPEEAASVDYESGLTLPGVSVNPLSPEPWWSRSLEDWLARQICNYVHIQERDPRREAWVLAGTVTARGPDNEPLLSEPRVVARLDRATVEEARHRYDTAFAAGRTSVAHGAIGDETS